MRAIDFYNSIGVVTHSTYYDTAYGYNNGNNLLPDLQYVGITQIRDGLDVPATGGLIEKLMAAGIKDDMVAGTFGNGVPAQTISAYITKLEAFEAATPGGVNSVEGFNEVSAANLQATESFQSQLYAAIKADPKLSGISLYNFTGSSFDASFYHLLGNVSATADYGNTHSYTEYFPPELWNSWFVPLGLGGTPGTPYVVTETGYDTSSLPEDVAAKETLNDVFDLIRDGASKAYLYELIDEQPDPGMTSGELHLGLFNNDGTPKPAATALHNLHAIIADTGATAATFTPGTLSYSLTGLNSAPVDRAALQAAFGYGIFQSYITNLPAYGNSLLLAKSDGTFDLAVWQEPMIYDGVNRIAAPVTPVTVTLGTVAASVEVFDPLLGTAPIATYTNVGAVTLQVTDHPLIVEIDPAAPTTIAAFTSAASSVTAHQGQIITFAVTTSAAVVVSTRSGAPTLSLSTGGTAIYTAAESTSTSLAFTTTVGAGQSSADLRVTGLALNGALITDPAGNALNASGLLSLAGANTNIAVSTAVPVMTLGSGPDVLTLDVSEDAFKGDAQFTVSVDGTQIGSTQTAVALYGAGTSQVFNVDGEFGSGPHQLAVAFTNDLANLPGDRNLYVNSVSYNGATETSATTAIYGFGAGTIQTDTFAVASTTKAVPQPVTLGAGPDSLVVNVGEDAYLGDAQFILSVDGVQVGGTQTTTVLEATGKSQAFTVLGDYGSGAHQLAVAFTNDLANLPGDRNLYVNSVSYNGATETSATTAIYGFGAGTIQTDTFAVASTTKAVPQPVTLGAGPDSLVVNVGEDAYLGDAQFILSVDGVQVGGTQTTTVLEATGKSQAFTVLGDYGSGAHQLAVAFTNDLANLPGDRNLYVNSVSYNGATETSATTAIYGFGAGTIQTDTFAVASTTKAVPQPVTLGAGPDSLVVNVGEDAYLGDAQFILSVDGVQVGGTQTTTVLEATGKSQAFTVLGDYGSGAHQLAVAFTNDLANLPGDRNLYVNSVSYNGATETSATTAIYGFGAGTIQTDTFAVASTTKAVPQPVTLGAGPDSLVVNVGEDAYLGDAQFTLSVDGVQVGGTQTTTVLEATGKSQAFTVLGDYGSGAHQLAVAFTNDLANLPGDRNLYVNSVSYNGATETSATTAIYGFGAGTIQTDTFAVASTAKAITTGLVVDVSEDAYQGDAQFIVTEDGQQVGGTFTATAIHGSGETQAISLGLLTTGPHQMGITFINDAYAGTPSTDRNLYVDGASYNGQAIAGSTATLLSTGSTAKFSATGDASQLVLNVAEDAYQGDAQFTVSIDGAQVGGVHTATASNALGQSQAFGIDAMLSAGSHDIGVTFINDAYAGTPSTDRNLYVTGASLNGMAVGGASATLLSNGTSDFTVLMIPK